MQPTCWPHHLNTLLAKSADRGGETLAQHTWDVLEKLAALYRLRPALSRLGQPGPALWHCLFRTCLLHDFRQGSARVPVYALWRRPMDATGMKCSHWPSLTG